MEHKDRAMKVEMLRSEIEEIKANLESIEARLAAATDPGARKIYEADRDETRAELKTREDDLASSGDGSDSPEVSREMLLSEIADLEEDMRSCEAHAATASGPAKELYEKERADLAEEVARLRRQAGGG
jgi:hypothetical protein